MSGQFVTMVPPQGSALSAYDRSKRSTSQPDSIPQAFRDAMAVREEVYVDEQKVPLDAEFDEDDARSWHWVVYASVASSSSPPPDDMNSTPKNGGTQDERKGSTASQIPIATIRLIPPPHPPNPYKEQDRHPDADPAPGVTEHAVNVKHPAEPYIKLGRLATLKEYRGLGLSKLLVNTALEWASKNPQHILPLPDPAALEKARIEGGEDAEEVMIWKGLCMVHAQTSVEGLWAKQGFQEELVDGEGKVEIEKEGRWWEEGIEHLGMWKKLRVDDKYYAYEST